MCFYETTQKKKQQSSIPVDLPVGVHLASSLLVVRDQLLVDLAAVLDAGQRILLVAFPHPEQDHDDWKTQRRKYNKYI